MSFLPDKDFAQNLMGDDDYSEGMTEVAEAIASEANSLRHRIYREEGAVLVEEDRYTGDVYVTNVDQGAAIDEWGSINNPAYAPMRTAVANVGLRMDEDPKP